MNRRATLTITTGTLPYSALVTGPGMHRLLGDIDVPWQWDHRQRCWLVPRCRVDELVAAAERAGHNVIICGGLW